MPVDVSSDELERLALKYRTLLRLRREPRPDDRRVLRELAAEFPGALRELDQFPVAELERRAAAAEIGVEAARCMVRYHRLMRAVLAAKRALGRDRDPSGARLRSIAASLPAPYTDDSELVRAAARPPSGRLTALVMARLARELGRATDELWQSLFPHPGAANRPWRTTSEPER